MLKVGAWTRYLWEVMSFFHPGLRGSFLETGMKLLFIVPAVILAVTSYIYLLVWFQGTGNFSLAFLFFFLHAAWVGLFFWLVRSRYRSGKGSAVFPKRKKSFSFQLPDRKG